jgi:transposase
MSQIKSWTVSDALWGTLSALVPAVRRPEGKQFQRKAGAGRKHMESRQIFAAIVYVLRTGCQWKALPREYGSASAMHKHFQRWQKAGFFLRMREAGLAEYDGMQGIAWEWQSIDGAMGKAPLATECVGPNPTDRKKNGRKRSLLVDARGVPLSIAVGGANVHDVKLLEQTLDGIAIERPRPDEEYPQHLCADAGYVCKDALATITARHYRPHVRPRKQEAEQKKRKPDYRARRWVVERSHSWLNGYRKLLVSFEKTEAIYRAMLYIQQLSHAGGKLSLYADRLLGAQPRGYPPESAEGGCRLPISRRNQSDLSACMGSIETARRAGAAAARNPITTSARAENTKTQGLPGCTSKR